jgi:serine phosphatase RsbU (regulator of sigma subunit)
MRGPDDLLRDFQTIMAVSRAMGSERDLDRLLGLILGAAADLVGADRASLFLVDAERGELWTRIAQHAQEIRLPLGSGIAGSVATTGATINIPEAYSDPRFNPDNDRRSGYRTHSILCMPLRSHREAVVGVIQVLNRRDARPFDAYDEQVLAALCSQAAVAIDNAQLIQRDRERERLARDMELARQIQLSLLPLEAPAFPGWAFRAYARSCDQTGGDYHDFIPVAGSLDVVVGDVSGHGLGAAMVMSTARALLHALEENPGDPGALVTRLNRLLERDLADDTFMSLLLSRLGADGSCAYVSAGHEPPLVWRAGRGFDPPGDTDFLLGMLDDTVYTAQVLPALTRGDLLVQFTDGIFEAQRPDGDLFGMERLRDTVAAHATEGASAVCAAVVAAVQAHLGSAPAHDDITLVVAERT